MSISPKQGKGDKIVVNEVKCTNGETVSFEGMSYYPKLAIGDRHGIGIERCVNMVACLTIGMEINYRPFHQKLGFPGKNILP